MGTNKTNNNRQWSSNDCLRWLFCVLGWTEQAYVHPYHHSISTRTNNTTNQYYQSQWVQSNKSACYSYNCWSCWRHVFLYSHHHASCNSTDLQKEEKKPSTKQVWYSPPATPEYGIWLNVLPLLISYSDHYTTTMHEASWTDKQSNRSTESKLSTGDNKEEHLYEPLPEHTSSQSDDPCMQQTSTVTNPYSMPNGDDGHLNTETRC